MAFKPVVVLLLALAAFVLCQEAVVSDFVWYSTVDDDNGREPCDEEVPAEPDYWVNNDDVVYYYFYGLDIPVYESASSASSLAPLMLVTAAAMVAHLV